MYNVLNETDYYPRDKHDSPHSPIPDRVYCKYCGERPAKIYEGMLKQDDGFDVVLYFCCEEHYKQYKVETQNE